MAFLHITLYGTDNNPVGSYSFLACKATSKERKQSGIEPGEELYYVRKSEFGPLWFIGKNSRYCLGLHWNLAYASRNANHKEFPSHERISVKIY